MPRGQMIGYEQQEEAAREREAALCKPAQHSAPARQQQHLHPMCPPLVFLSTHTASAFAAAAAATEVIYDHA